MSGYVWICPTCLVVHENAVPGLPEGVARCGDCANRGNPNVNLVLFEVGA